MRKSDLIAFAIIAAVAIFGLLCWAAARGATVTLYWTAPGDDGIEGRASQYDLRWASYPPDADTLAWWQSATKVPGIPLPGPVGDTDSVSAELLPGHYVFNLRVADEVPNWSGWSNWLVVDVSEPSDTVAPAPVRDLRITVWPNPSGTDGFFR